MHGGDPLGRGARSTCYMVSVAGESVILGLVEDVTDRFPARARDDSDTFPLVR